MRCDCTVWVPSLPNYQALRPQYNESCAGCREKIQTAPSTTDGGSARVQVRERLNLYHFVIHCQLQSTQCE